MNSWRSVSEQMPHFQEEGCERALFQSKWPHGFRCPRCNGSAYYPIASRHRRLYECRSCAHQTSLTAGTIMEGTRTPLVKWFQALFMMQAGISARLLAELIQVTYKTAWLINHKLRHAIQIYDEGRLLKGELQLYGDFYARPVMNYHSDPLGQRDQPTVAGVSINTETRDIEQVKIKKMPRTGFAGRVFGIESYGNFLWRHVVSDSSSIHSIEIVKQSGVEGVTALGLIWRGVIGWLARTFGGIGPKHLQAYLDEYCFRINARADVFGMLVSLCGTVSTITLRQLVSKRSAVHAIRWTSLGGGKLSKRSAVV